MAITTTFMIVTIEHPFTGLWILKKVSQKQQRMRYYMLNIREL